MIGKAWRTIKAALVAACDEWRSDNVNDSPNEREAEIEAIAAEFHQRGANGSSRAAAEAFYEAWRTVKGELKIWKPEGGQLGVDRRTTTKEEQTEVDVERLERRIQGAWETALCVQDQLYGLIDMLEKRIDALQPKPQLKELNAQR
jgi:hypothetical protein